MPAREELLNPIPGNNPAGADLRYDPLYDKIKEARREEEDIPQGAWERPRKLADWPLVIKLISEALTSKTKDLQLAAWLTEALLRRESFAGLGGGLALLRELMEKFWDGLYPIMEEGDLELRAAPLEWVGTRFDFAVKSQPVNKSGHSYWQYKESLTIPAEKDTEKDKEKAATRKKALEDGKIPPELFEKSFEATPKTWYRQQIADLNAAAAALEALDATSKAKFADTAPTYRPLRESLEEELRLLGQFLVRKLETDPDPVEQVAAAGGEGGGDVAVDSGPLAAEPVDRNDATNRAIGAARFIRRTEPTSPVSYLMLRALRWGELRAEAPTPDPRLLEAPHAQTRTQLKTLLLDQDYAQLLEVAETVMGSRAGRGWLDLQRYVLNAFDGLGADYAAAAQTVRRELRAFLSEIPTLPEMTLMDDLPTAGPATLQWLRTEGLIAADGGGGEAEVEGGGAGPRPDVSGPAYGGRDSLLDRALAEVKAGQANKAIDRIKRALDRETSERGRFIRQTQLARVMLEAGLDTVALPILKQLVAKVDEHKLDGWEAGPVIAETIILLYRAYEKTNTEPKVRQELYLRICRLDPVQALNLGPSKAATNAEA
jgi:type VI secretion system protein ImpA